MTNHQQAAQNLLDRAADIDSEHAARNSPPDGPSEVTRMIAEIHAAAQVHATLALVEQQRIANLLAYAQFRWTEPPAGTETTLSVVFPAAMSALQEAGRALGMEPRA
jgi:hypothetical protein